MTDRESKTESTCHAYALIDPRVKGDMRDRIFYVGKGTGSRAEKHEIESGENKKLDRIAEIKAEGLNYEIAYFTIKGNASLTKREALNVEASLIWALRPQLTNDKSGHYFSFISSRALEVASSAKDVSLERDENAILVWASGIHGGVDFSGSFIAPSDEVMWENSRHYWSHGKKIREALDREVAAGRPVALISVTGGRRGTVNVVNGVVQLCGWYQELDKSRGNRFAFERLSADQESSSIRQMREHLLGNQLVQNGIVFSNPHNNWKRAKKGQQKLPRALGRVFE